MDKKTIVLFIILACIIGVGVGYALTPEYATMIEQKSAPSMSLGNPDRNLEKRYLDGMIAHHKSAIYMAEQAREKSTRPEILSLANIIIKVDTEDIATIESLRKTLYPKSQTSSAFQKINLGDANDRFDLRFLNALIIHHEEAIEVAREAQTKSTRSAILEKANGVETSLRAGLEQLKKWRKEWYVLE